MAVRPSLFLLAFAAGCCHIATAQAAVPSGPSSQQMSVGLRLVAPCTSDSHATAGSIDAASTFAVACTDGAAPRIEAIDATAVDVRTLPVGADGRLHYQVVTRGTARVDQQADAREVVVSVEY